MAARGIARSKLRRAKSEGVSCRRGLFYPDFTLVSARGRVLVEVVGYWTPEYLASKAEGLRAVEVPMVVCVDELHACGDLSPRSGVLAYRGRVDASALVAEAERMLELGGYDAESTK